MAKRRKRHTAADASSDQVKSVLGDFEHFVESLISAIQEMDSYYIQLPVAGLKERKYRERVYCYELYHQLRNTLGDGFPYKLMGELDKVGGAPIVREEVGARKPDFVVHKPGHNDGNLVVIEVKPLRKGTGIQPIRKDIVTLRIFLSKADYQHAIMLVYGNENPSLLQKIPKEIRVIGQEYSKNILLVWHPESDEKPKVVEFPK